ncbi:MAG: RNA-binding cell elongation regulator Jag/EloR [Bacillota bacterium]|nr:RNA-binding cell elongation regulator Jag/EloR [Bacillota bacterium]
MDFSEKWGRSVEEAVSLALNDLKVPLEEVKVTVLEEPTKGFLGLGSKLAKVRVEKLPPQEKKREEKKPGARVTQEAQPQPEKKADKAPEEGGERAEEEAEAREKREGRSSRKGQSRRRGGARRERGEDFPDSEVRIREKPENLEETTDTPALPFLRDMTEKMGLSLEVKAYKNEECLYIDISGKDSGTIIGKRGQTLDAVQYLTSLVVNKGEDNYLRVIVDAENYREKREKTLEQLATRLADKVRRSGKNVRLEPMNPYERKVIHSTLQKYPGVQTRSEGEEPYRRVVIEKK